MLKPSATAMDDVIPGSNIRQSDKYKMRLYEAFFLEEFRDEFMRRNDSLSRTQLDARNSETQSVKPYHELVCNKYNNETWLPQSKIFPLFHHELMEMFELHLNEGQSLTYRGSRTIKHCK